MQRTAFSAYLILCLLLTAILFPGSNALAQGTHFHFFIGLVLAGPEERSAEVAYCLVVHPRPVIPEAL